MAGKKNPKPKKEKPQAEVWDVEVKFKDGVALQLFTPGALILIAEPDFMPDHWIAVTMDKRAYLMHKDGLLRLRGVTQPGFYRLPPAEEASPVEFCLMKCAEDDHA